MRHNIGTLLPLAAGAMFLAACGGGKVVVTPTPSPIVATAPAAPVSFDASTSDAFRGG
jgi:hypothetical protein